MKIRNAIYIFVTAAAIMLFGAAAAHAEDFENVSMYPFTEQGAFDGLTNTHIAEIERRAKIALNNMAGEVDISDMKINRKYLSSVYNVIFRLREDNPGYFYVEALLDSTIQGDTISTVQLNYIYSRGEVVEKTSEIVKQAVEIMAMMYKSGVKTDFDKALWLHDYIVLNSEYDGTLSKHGIDNILLEGTAVCQGYTNTYKYLLNIAGIKSVNVYNNAREHEWSRVLLDGKWYNVDVTFDDPSFEYVHDCLGNVEHTYFLLTDAEIQQYEKHEPENMYTGVTSSCTDTKYSGAAFHDARTGVAFIGDRRYYVTYDCDIVQCDNQMNVINPSYYHIDDLWYVRDRKNEFFNGYFGGLGAMGNYLYYNTPNKIMRINTASQAPAPQIIFEYTPRESYFPSGAYLFGSYVRGDVLFFAEANYLEKTDSDGNVSLSLHGTRNDKKMALSIRD